MISFYNCLSMYFFAENLWYGPPAGERTAYEQIKSDKSCVVRIMTHVTCCRMTLTFQLPGILFEVSELKPRWSESDLKAGWSPMVLKETNKISVSTGWGGSAWNNRPCNLDRSAYKEGTAYYLYRSSQGFSWSPSNRYLNRTKLELAATRLCNNHIIIMRLCNQVCVNWFVSYRISWWIKRNHSSFGKGWQIQRILKFTL